MTAALEPKYNCLLKCYLMKIRGHVEGHSESYCEGASNCLLLMSFASFKWLKQGRLWNCAFIHRLNCVMQTVQMCDYPGSLSGCSRIVCHLLRIAHKILAFVLFTLWKKWIAFFTPKSFATLYLWFGLMHMQVWGWCVYLLVLYV